MPTGPTSRALMYIFIPWYMTSNDYCKKSILGKTRVVTLKIKLHHDVVNLIWTIQCTQICLCIHQEDVADATLEYSNIQVEWSIILSVHFIKTRCLWQTRFCINLKSTRSHWKIISSVLQRIHRNFTHSLRCEHIAHALRWKMCKD